MFISRPAAFRTPWLVLLVAVCISASPARATDPNPPTLDLKAGPAQVKATTEAATWDLAQAGQSVPFGAVLKTGNGFEGTLRYADGTTLVVKPLSILQVLSDGLRLYRGQTWIKVVKRGRGFTCVTPSAIASVRGTSFTCEVPSMSRVFGRRLKNEFFDARHLSVGVRGHLVSVSIGLAVLGDLLAEAPGGRVPATVKVFEGRVLVSYPAQSGSIKRQWMLDPGEQVVTDRGESSEKIAVAAADYATWGLPAPSTAPARTVTVDEDRPRPISGAPDSPISILNEPYDVK